MRPFQRAAFTALVGLTAMVCGCLISVVALEAREVARYLNPPHVQAPPAAYAFPLAASPYPTLAAPAAPSPTPPPTSTPAPSPTPPPSPPPTPDIERARLYLEQREYAAAAAEFSAFVESNQADSDGALAEAHLGRGMARFYLREWSAALADFDAAAALNPALADAYAWRGYILSERREYARALPDLRQAVALDGGDPLKHIRLAAALLGNRQPREALDEYTAALTLAPYSVEAHAGVVRSAAELGDFTLVERHLAHTASIAPYDPTALNARAWVYARYQQEHLFEAEQLAQQAADRARDDLERARCLYTLGWAYAQQGRYDEAIAALEEAAALAEVEGAVVYTEIPALLATLRGEQR